MTEQLSYFLDRSAIDVIQGIAQKAASKDKSIWATVIGISLALFGASGVFGQLQDALNTIWGVKTKSGAGIWGFLRNRFLSFAMVGGICFLLLVSMTVESLLKAFSHYIQALFPGGIAVAVAVYLLFDLAVVMLMLAMIFKILPDAKIRWRGRNSAISKALSLRPSPSSKLTPSRVRGVFTKHRPVGAHHGLPTKPASDAPRDSFRNKSNRRAHPFRFLLYRRAGGMNQLYETILFFYRRSLAVFILCNRAG